MTRIKEDFIRDVMMWITHDKRIAKKKLIESIFRLMKEALASGDGVMISGFGDFQVSHKRPRMGRNPKTRKEHEISERNVVTLHPAKVFRTEMNP